MSRIYFHSEHGTAEVRGWERAHMGVLSTDLLKASLILHGGASRKPTILRAIPLGEYVHAIDGYALERDLDVWLSVAIDHEFLIDGHRADVFTVALNTALALGNDVVKLCARLHGQCEIHCYVEGPHRAWLAGIIEQGRKIGLLRKDSGWEDVITLLRSRADEPVVCSYSVCEQFPNYGIVRREGVWTAPRVAWDADFNERPLEPGEEGEEDTDAWYDKPKDEQWQLALIALRQQASARHLELTPDGWDTYYFEQGLTGFDVQAWADAQEKEATGE